MAGNIKGITIEIDGNTKKLNTALKSVNQDLKDTQYKLKDVENALKFSPGNTELLEKKFKLLGDAVTESKDKLKLLEEAEKQAAQQLQNGDIGQKEFEALQLKVEAARTEVEKSEKALESFGSVAKQQLKATIDEAAHSLDDTKQKLADFDKALQFNPGSTELLQAKFEALGDAVQEAQDRVEMLEAAQEEAAQMLEQGEISVDEYNELSMALEEARYDADNLKAAYVDFGSVALQKISLAGKELEALGNKAEKVGGVLNKALTVPVVAVGTASVASFNAVDNGLDIVTQKTGATGEALASMQESVKNLATEIPTDFETAGSAVGEVNTRFGLTGKELEDLSGKFIKFAELNNTDVSASIDNVQSVMAAWGVEAEDAGKLLDTLNKAGQDTGVSVDSLAQAMAQNKTYLDEMGFSVSDSAMFLANLSKNGVDASATLTGMKKALVNATKEGKTSKEALAELQDTIKNSASDTEAYQKAMELFGNKAGPAIADAVRDGRLSFEELGTSLEDFAGNVENTFEETLDPSDEFKKAMNALKIQLAEVGTVLLEMVNPYLEKLTKALQELKKKWDGLSPKQKDMIVKFALIAAAIGPVISGFGKVAKAIGGVMKLAPMLGKVIAALVSPFGLVVAAIAAVIAITVIVIKHWDQIKAKATELGQHIKAKWEELKQNTIQKWNDIKNSISQKWNEIKTDVANKINAVKTSIAQGWENIKSGAVAKWSEIKTSISAKWDEIKNNIQAKLNGVKTAIDTGWNTIKTAASTGWNNIKGAILGVWDKVRTEVNGKIDLLKSGIAQKWDAIKNEAGSKLSGIVDKIAQPFRDAKSRVSGALDNIKRMFPISLGNIFSNIKLPHFRVSGGRAPWGIGGKGSLPSFSVSWYKKAYDNAVMFQDPTVLPTTSGYKGFGDGNGSEIVMGKEYMLNMIREAIGGSQLARNMGAVGQILSTYLPEIASKEMRVSGQDLVYANSQNINRTLGAETVLTGRGVR